jgi:repressor LexA
MRATRRSSRASPTTCSRCAGCRCEAKDGQIIIARLGDDVTVKRLKRRANGIELIAENPDYENIFVETGSADFALEGIAVGLIRPGEF